MNISDEQLQDRCTDIRAKILPLQSHNPKGSIVFPAYNEEGYILPTINALSNITTHLPLEIIAINNASTDRTREILEQCGLIVVDEKRKGVSYARSAGLEAAKGEIIFQTDADTKVPKTWVDEHYKNFDEDVGGVIGGIDFEDIHVLFRLYMLGGISLHMFLSLFNKRPLRAGGANLSYRKETATKIGGFHKGTNQGEDILLFQKLNTIAKIKTVKNRRINTLTSGRRFDDLEKTLTFIQKRVSGLIGRVRTNYRVEAFGNFEDVR